MKITEICESTTSGSVATVAAPMNGGPLKRSAVGKGVYGKEPAGSLLTGKKTNARYANSVKEGAGENLKSQTPTLGRNFGECKSCRGLGGFGPGHKCRACNGTGMVDLKTSHNGGRNNQTNEEGGFPGEKVTVIYVDGQSLGVKYAKPEEADKALKLLRKKYPNKKIEHKQEVKEAGMPAAVIKHKQKLAGMTDAELAERLKDKSDDELKKMAERHGYGKMSPHYVNRVKKGKEIKEDELRETDLIIGPGQGHRLKSGFISRAEDRRDHEVEMARSDLHQAHKNSSKIHKLIKNVSEDEGLEGWVQAKITKAADYLNSVCQYLEGKQLQEMTGGVIAGGGVGEGINESDVEDRLLAIAKKYPRRSGKPYTGTRVPDGIWDHLSAGTHIETELGITNHIAARRKALQNLEKDIRYYYPYLGGHSIEQLQAIRSQLHPDDVSEGDDQLEEGMGLKQLAAAAAALGLTLAPSNAGDGTNRGSSADRAYDTYLSQTPSHLVPRYMTPPKGK
jgi:hypothetical protein